MPAGIVRFGLFELDLAEGALIKQGRRIRLQEQPFRVLLILLEHPGQTVSREQLRQALWTADTFVDFERGLNAAVAKLRQALGDSAGNPRFIETQARRGYRFIAPVDAALEPVTPLCAVEPPKPEYRRQSLVWIAAAVLSLLLIGSGILYYWTHRAQRKPLVDSMSAPVPLTTDLGFQSEPAFSPEGSRVAFAWQERKRPSKIFIKLLGSSEPVHLTTGEGNDFTPAWSPDGRYIAFLRYREPSTSMVMLIPSLGGPERELTSLHLQPVWFLARKHWTAASPRLSWALNNKWLLTLEQDQLGSLRIVRISVESGERTPLNPFSNSPAAGANSYGGLALSSDGRTLAFSRSLNLLNSDLFVVNLSAEMLPEGPPRPVHFEPANISGIAWAPDGLDLVVSCDRRGPMEVWRVPVDSRREPENLNVNDGGPGEVSVSKPAQRLVFAHYSDNVDIWRVDLRSTGGSVSAPFITSTRYEARPAYSSDGKHVVFESDRTGNEEIWTANSDGSQPVQLTAFGKGWAGSPAWSPDNRQIAFDTDAAGPWNIWTVPALGGKPYRLTPGSKSETRPTWSHDGKWIYYSAPDKNSVVQVWKKPVAGGTGIQVTRKGGTDQMESADRAFVYYLKPDGRGRQLWRVPWSGGEETPVLTVTGEMQFRLGERGVYFWDSSTPALIKYLDLASGVSKPVGNLQADAGPQTGLAVSPDERWLLIAGNQFAGSQLMLVEKFH